MEMDIVERINKLKREKNAIILAHNYQPEEIQRVADFIGDSLELCRIAEGTDADIVVFCGVDFMAETAKILNKDKKVLIPEIKDTECPMAHQLSPEMLIEAKKRHPNAKVVIYINTLSEAKVLADGICTSANAHIVVNSFKEDEIIFGPDRNLGYFVEKRTKKKIIPVPEDGHCYVHKKFTIEDILRAKEKYPNAQVLVHPECDPEVDYVYSTGGMVKHVLNSPEKEFIIGTEVDMITRLKIELEKRGEEKRLIPLREDAICEPMKRITLEKLERCLLEERYEVVLDEKIIEGAKRAIDYMLSISRSGR